jgi:hypothetical protein
MSKIKLTIKVYCCCGQKRAFGHDAVLDKIEVEIDPSLQEQTIEIFPQGTTCMSYAHDDS